MASCRAHLTRGFVFCLCLGMAHALSETTDTSAVPELAPPSLGKRLRGWPQPAWGVSRPDTHVQRLNAPALFPITGVTVFAESADVTREGELELTPGTNELQLVGLPASMAPDSVRVSGTGKAQILMVRRPADGCIMALQKISGKHSLPTAGVRPE